MWTGIVIMKKLHKDGGLALDSEIEWELGSDSWDGRILPPGRRLPK